jgi:hypothetical protein
MKIEPTSSAGPGASLLPAACRRLPSSPPAFILGNGPTLPTAALPALADRFTIGVNRILRSGFVPTVILWGDLTVYGDDGPAMDASGALLVCDRSVARRAEHVGLRTFAGDDSRRRRATPWTLLCDGNTGCCAARWALSLLCRPVYLLGMSSAYEAGRTDFYGRNRWHDAGALGRMRRQRQLLLSEHGADVHVIGDADELRRVAAAAAAIDQDDMRQQLRAFLTAGEQGNRLSGSRRPWGSGTGEIPSR